MKFGKLPDISNVDFRLPEDPTGTTELLTGLPERLATPKLYVGCTGWSMKEWNGKVYPEKTKAKDYLKYYAQQFNTIELNTTHYRIPNLSTIEKWYQESSSDFRFCPKIPQVISHSNDLGYGGGRVLEFAEAIQGLKEKLGHCFMQLPPYFGIDRLPVLQNFMEHWPNHIPLSIEFRHESWFKTSEQWGSATKSLEQYKMATVITDVAGRRDVLHMRLTSDTAVIRFVGNGLVNSDYTRIDAWIQRLGNWFNQGLRLVYFFPHEPDNILAPELAKYFVEQAQEKLEIITRGPDLEKYTGGGQISLF
jgi:uncharacterized protein YecE (DUF72 family)